MSQDTGLRLWHNPRCSKSRQALSLLTGAGRAPEIYLYLQDPPNADAIDRILGKLGHRAIDLVRRGQAEWASSGLGPDSAEADIRAAFQASPILIERPILETATAAIVGRPPETVLTLVR